MSETIWQEHDAYLHELKRCQKKHKDLFCKVQNAKNLLSQQFSVDDRKELIDPGKIHRVTSNSSIWEIWKMDVAVDNLRPSQFPRMWFGVSGDTIMLLAIHTHMENYDNNKVDRIAEARYTDYN